MTKVNGIVMSNKGSNNTNKGSNEFSYEVLQECGTLSTRSYTKRNGETVTEEVKLRFISWNGSEPKYDIRPWSDEGETGEKCLKTRGLTGEELVELGKIITALQQEEEKPKAKTKAKSAACNATTSRATSATTKKATTKAKAATKKGSTRK